ncbi:sensor histidine kinase [Crenalkalicoccus roseus]|uniref:sensor histidine kinase n=1 Tax=Crenalkalicoccus roseus TaxID=1485588 RepID=UPI001080F3B0|nr:histidine kinase dimerization/phosphoacceptor domain -containing protein [Crenalkalicoccus roseus]
MNPPDPPATVVLEVLREPCLMLGAGGRIAFANRAAEARFGPGLRASALEGLCPAPEEAARLRAWLRRASGSRAPLPGAVTLRDAAGQPVRFRGEACLLVPPAEGRPGRLLLRLAETGDERFSALARQVRELNEEVRHRRRVQALLEEAVRERDLLLRELHHRVKNNIHMLAGMLAAARREAASPEAAAVLAEAQRRLAAVGAVHQMLYLEGSLHSVRGEEIVGRLGAMVMESAGARERLHVAAAPVEIPNDAAVPLALILNELLANALKHGVRPDGSPGLVRVALDRTEDGAIELAVEDEGPGFEPEAGALRRASGLGLVRGLARQLGAAFAIGRGEAGGARCVLRFRDRRGEAAGTGEERRLA